MAAAAAATTALVQLPGSDNAPTGSSSISSSICHMNDSSNDTAATGIDDTVERASPIAEEAATTAMPLCSEPSTQTEAAAVAVMAGTEAVALPECEADNTAVSDVEPDAAERPDGDDDGESSGTPSCDYEERIIDFENIRIIEHVIDSAYVGRGCKKKKRKKKVTANGDEPDKAAAAEPQAPSESADGALVAFIGESYQNIDSGRSTVSAESAPSAAAADDDDDDDGVECAATSTAQPKARSSSEREDAVDDNNNKHANNKNSAEKTPAERLVNGLMKYCDKRVERGGKPQAKWPPGILRVPQRGEAAADAVASTTAAAVSAAGGGTLKALHSKLQPLAAPFQPAASRAAKTKPKSAAPAKYAYEQNTIFYPPQQQQQQQQQELVHQLNEQAHVSNVTHVLHMPQLAAAAASKTTCQKLQPQAHYLQHLTQTLAPQQQQQQQQQQQLAATGQTHLYAAVGGAWPLVEAPIYIDVNGEYRTFCPAHGPPPTATPVGMGVAMTLAAAGQAAGQPAVPPAVIGAGNSGSTNTAATSAAVLLQLDATNGTLQPLVATTNTINTYTTNNNSTFSICPSGGGLHVSSALSSCTAAGAAAANNKRQQHHHQLHHQHHQQQQQHHQRGKKQKDEAASQPPAAMFAQGAFYYCPTAVQMVSQNRPPPMPVPVQVPQGAQVMQPYVNESGTLTHVVLSAQQYQQLHPGQGHIHAPFLTANGTSHFYSPLPGPAGYAPGSGPPTHYHTLPSGHLSAPQQQAAQQQQPTSTQQQPMSHSPHSPSPPSGGGGGGSYHKDERSQRQHTKLLRKLEKQREFNSAMSTPAHSPRRNDVNGHHTHAAAAAAATANSSNSQALATSAAAQGAGGAPINNNNNNSHNHANHSNQQGMYPAAAFLNSSNNNSSHHNSNSRRNAPRSNGMPITNYNNSTAAAALPVAVVSTNSSSAAVSASGSSGGGSAIANEEPLDEDEDDYQASIAEQLSLIQKPEVVDITSRSAKIVWEAPALTEPQLIDLRELRYNVLLSDPAKQSKYKSLYKGESYDCIVQDLQPGQEYVVRVQVHYEKLQGNASEPTEFTTPACEPDQPQPPKVVNRTKNSLQLRWTNPPANGAPILHYLLEYDEGRGGRGPARQPLHFVEAVRTKGKQFSVNKLQPSTVYNFRLAAVNELGPSLYSLICTHNTAGQAPSAPRPPTLQAHSATTLRLTWERQEGNYVLQMQERDAALATHATAYLAKYNGPDCAYECCQLRRATAYQFRLCVETEDGRSPWSAEVTYKTAPERPGRPGKPHAKGKIHGTFFRVRWDAPTDTGGAEILRYYLEMNAGTKYERIYSGTEPETNCDRLQPGTTYQLRAACEGPAGTSAYSEVAHITAEAVVPGAPAPPQLDSASPPGPYASVLRLSKPDYMGGAPLLEYEVQLRAAEAPEMEVAAANSVYRGKDAYCVVGELRPGCAYEAQARAYNRIGAGAWSSWLRFAAAAAPPEKPAEPKVLVKSATHLCVSWLEPAGNGAPITEYRLESAANGSAAGDSSVEEAAHAFQLCYQGAQTSAELRNLLPYTLYYFRLNARNVAGASAWTPLVNAQTPAAVPAAPAFKDYEFTANEVSLTWTQPDAHGSPITAYTIEYGERSVSTPDATNEYTLSGLTPETAYKFRVQALNAIGSGPFSAYAKLTTLPSPPVAPPLECTGSGHNFIKLKWGDGRKLDFTKYYVEMYVQRAKEFQVVYTGTNCMCKVNKLQERTAYTFRICADNDRGGVGDFSVEYVFATTAALPSSIKAPRAGSMCLLGAAAGGAGGIASGVLPETPTSFFAGLGNLSLGMPLLLEWQSSKNSFSDAVDYVLQYAIGKDGDFKQIYRGGETKFTIENLAPGQLYQFRVCPVRVTSVGEDLAGQYTSPFRYQVPQLPSIEDFDSNLLSSAAASVFGACGAAAAGGGGGGGPNTCHGHTHMHSHHSHHHAHHGPPPPHSHHAHHAHHNSSHNSRHNGHGGGGGGGVGNTNTNAGGGLHHRSVSASALQQHSSATLSGASGVHPATGIAHESANTLLLGPSAIGLIPLGSAMANELAAGFAAGCDDPLHHHHHHHHHPFHGVATAGSSEAEHHLLAGQQLSGGAGSNTSSSAHHSLHQHPLLANAAASVVAAAAAAAAAAGHHNNAQAHAHNGAIRRYVAKLTSVYTNRKRFSDQEKAVIFMVSFLFFTFLFATLVKMFMR